MFERFTDRARKVMQLANQEAQRFNHEYVGTEHILLGLIKEGHGVGPLILKNAVDGGLDKIRWAVEGRIARCPDMVTMGKLPQTPRAKKVIEFAVEEATALGHNYIGTEHLLLGLIREQEGVAAEAMKACGLTLADLREEALLILGVDSYGKPNPSGESDNLDQPGQRKGTRDDALRLLDPGEALDLIMLRAARAAHESLRTDVMAVGLDGIFAVTIDYHAAEGE